MNDLMHAVIDHDEMQSELAKLRKQVERYERYLGSIVEALEPDNKDGSVTQAWVMRARNYARAALKEE